MVLRRYNPVAGEDQRSAQPHRWGAHPVHDEVLAELEARIQALLRRGSGTTGALLTFGSLVMDRNARRAWLNNKPITLTSRETLILEFLLLNKSMIVSKDHIIEAVCKPREKMSYAALDVQFTRLRAKLAPAKVRVVSIRGLGYLLAEPDDEEQ